LWAPFSCLLLAVWEEKEEERSLPLSCLCPAPEGGRKRGECWKRRCGRRRCRRREEEGRSRKRRREEE